MRCTKANDSNFEKIIYGGSYMRMGAPKFRSVETLITKELVLVILGL